MVTHGPPWSVVPAPGPLLPAEALTEMPAWNASRNASSTGVGVRVRAARDREVDDVDAVEDRLLHRGDGVGAEAALREADAVHDHVRAGRDAADRAAVDAVEHGGVDAVARGGRRRVRAVTLGVARRADAGRVVAELVGRRRRRSPGRCQERVGADQLVVAGERRPEVGDVAAVAELAAVGAAGRSRQAVVGERSGARARCRCRSRRRSTFEPALSEPPSDGQTVASRR